MYSRIPKLKPIFVWVALGGLCFSCAEKKGSEADAKISVSKPEPTERIVDTIDAVMQKLIINYSVTKLSQLSTDYDLGYTLFVVSEDGIALTSDASTLYDYRVKWNYVVVETFSDSGAIVDFGRIVNLNSLADSLELGQMVISARPGSLSETAFEVSGESGMAIPMHIRCETLLADSSGIVCALGFSTKP